jgi:hypothetical protein
MKDMANTNASQSSTSKPKVTSPVTLAQVMEAVESGEYIGICLACGEEHGGVEPDARNYVCERCDARQVFGAEELLIRFAF